MRLLAAALLFMVGVAGAIANDVGYPAVTPGVRLTFPADHGAHPQFRTEWWYVTGWLETQEGRELGFQVTFFRTRPDVDTANPSSFAPRQVLFAHAAVSDPAVGTLLHDARAARAGFGIAQAASGDASITLRDWSLKRLPDGRFITKVVTPDFALELSFSQTQEIFLQGEDGYSRKGSDPADASYYYSMPHLETEGTLTRQGQVLSVTGKAWLDREWSSNFLSPDAVGWDWTGLNFDDGSALVAFRIRGRNDETIWTGGSFRRPDGRITHLAPDDIDFTPVERWRSPRTDALYPIEQVLTIRLPEGVRSLPLKPLFADQELDARASGLPVYWEGAVRTDGGKGYLELTGYAAPLSL